MFTYKQYSKLVTRIVLSIAILIGITIQNAQADLLITLGDPPSVLRYDLTGNFLGDFVTPGSGGIDLPQMLTYGPDGNLYVASFGSQNVLRYNGVTGEFIDVFVPAGSGGLGGAFGVTFGPDGNLYVTSYFYSSPPGVRRYNGKTGTFIDVFVQGEFHTPAFGPDGNLYVTSSTGVLRFDGKTGLPYPAPGESGAFFAPAFEGPLTFGPNGDLFLMSDCRTVARYDRTTGAFISTFITDVPLPFDQCISGMAFGPDGNFYITGYYSTVYRYDGKTGAFINSFGSGQRGTISLTFTPLPTNKDQCKNGGWRNYGFKNQGQCIQYVNTQNEHNHGDNHNQR
jgi:WD40 repeat protein